MNSVISNNVCLKYHRPTPFGCKDIGIRKFEFAAKTQFLIFRYQVFKINDTHHHSFDFKPLKTKIKHSFFIGGGGTGLEPSFAKKLKSFELLIFKHFCVSSELPNQNLRKIGQWIYV